MDSDWVYHWGILIDGNMVSIEIEVGQAPLVNMQDLSILIENWPMEMRGECINVTVVLETSFHPAEPNYDIRHATVEMAKESDLYTDEDIAAEIQSDWNRTAAAPD